MKIKQSRIREIIKEEVENYLRQNPGTLDEGFFSDVGSKIKDFVSQFKKKPSKDMPAKATATRPDTTTMELIRLVGTSDAAKAFGMEGGQDFGVGSLKGIISISDVIGAIKTGKENIGRTTVDIALKNMLARLPGLMVNYNDKVKKQMRVSSTEELNLQKQKHYFSEYNKLQGIIAKLGEFIKSGKPKESYVAPLQELQKALLGMLQATQTKFKYSFGESKAYNKNLQETNRELELERRKLVKKINKMINERYVMRKLGLLRD